MLLLAIWIIVEWYLDPLQPAAMRDNGATGLEKQIPAMGLVKWESDFSARIMGS
jgi:hypothetical protein